jgi:hypothetical protein
LISWLLSTSGDVQISILQSASVRKLSQRSPGSSLVTMTRRLPEGLWTCHSFEPMVKASFKRKLFMFITENAAITKNI